MIEREFYRHKHNGSGRLVEDSGPRFTWQEILRLSPCAIVIESPSGAGKSHFLRQLARREPSRYVYREAIQMLENLVPADGRTLIIDGLDELEFHNRTRRRALLESLSQNLRRTSDDLQLVIATRLGTWTNEDLRILAEFSAQKTEHLDLAHLDNDQIRELAKDLGIEDVESFILRGPPSLCGLYPYEIEIFARTRVEYTGSWLTCARVLREASFASSVRHVPSLTLEKWSTGLSRLAAAACLMDRQTFTLDLCTDDTNAMQAWRLLPDWTPAEQRELFSGSLFSKKTESLYFIRGGLLRSLVVLLAASWCTERLRSGVEPDDCKFWVDDTSGLRHVPKRLGSLLGWVGSSLPALQKEITTKNPEIWMAGGDIQSLPDTSDVVTRAFDSFLSSAAESNFLPLIADATIQSIAPYIASRLDAVSERSLALRRLYFRIRAVAGCVSPYEAVAFAESLFADESPFGVAEFHEPSVQSLSAAIARMSQAERDLVFELANTRRPVVRLLLKLSALPNSLDSTVVLLSENVAVFAENTRSENYLRFVVRRLAKFKPVEVLTCLVSSEVLGQSRHAAVPFLLERILEIEERTCDAKTIAQVLVGIIARSHLTIHEFKRPGSFDVDPAVRSPSPGKVISRRLNDDRELRGAFWKCFVTAASNDPTLWSRQLLFIAIEPEDLEWLCADQTPPSLFRRMIEAAQAKRADAEKPHNPDLEARLSLTPKETLAECLTADTKNDYWYISFNVDKLGILYGKGLIPHILRAAGNLWRGFGAPLKESDSQAAADDVDICLAAIDIEYQTQGLKNILPSDAETALRLASWAEGAFPLWMLNVESGSDAAAQQIRETLRCSIQRTWVREDASPWLLDHARLGVLGPTLAGLVAERLVERPPASKNLSIAAVWALRSLDDVDLIRRIVARRESDMPEVAHLWIDLLANHSLRRAESRLTRFLDTSNTGWIPSAAESILRERPYELHPTTLVRIAEYILAKHGSPPIDVGDVQMRALARRVAAPTPAPVAADAVIWDTHLLRACVRGLMYNKVSDPRAAFARLRSVYGGHIEQWAECHVADAWASLSCRFVDEEQILELERSGESLPRTLDDLWRLVRRHIDIIKRDAETGDFNPRRIFGVVEEHRRCRGEGVETRQWEILAQIWFADQLCHVGRRFYHVGREEEVWASQDRIDISASAGGFRVPIEMKLIEYSEPDFQDSIKHQLYQKYMKPDGVHYGAFVIIRTRDKPFKGGVPFETLLGNLQRFAERTLYGTGKSISVIGIDLALPPTTSGKSTGKRSRARSKPEEAKVKEQIVPAADCDRVAMDATSSPATRSGTRKSSGSAP